MTPTRPDAAVEKSLRLIILMELQDAGRLEGMTVRKIAAEHFPGVHWTTTGKDIKAVIRLRDLLKQVRKESEK